ncbi:NADH:ubiquinone oxidoreductase subunit L [Pedobacter antarcticus 4BY]|uniref:NADH:ubiquinone oxidoreductase subunit L n=2 Tax=Pedobacter antarcticus TaxID=34086 RepID=A0A081PFP8_9SPHI|nr:NADH-quinone oxidoreductase subunit L [Pedobacter antarcticus]KEQ29521.1 NADH:ubiquinone oxidoreductase subunit L [Pedobacter antarcticus 4BY]SFF10671.1 NADH dehydrogenase subunit L [Pedobacter antarcticus]
MINLVWLVPLIPLLGFVINGLGRNTLSKSLIGFIGSGVIFISFLISVSIFLALGNDPVKSHEIFLFDWISAGTLQVPLSFLVDPLSSIMLLIITGIGFLIHIYSIGYMHDDAGFGKFFSYLNLFIFFMLLLVLGSNYLVMFIGWEGVGLCSYLLIGFWYTNSSYATAAKKAFVMNRIGDLGFLIAIFMIFTTFGSIEYAKVFPQVAELMPGDSTLALIALLLFIAACGKSAQIPLFTWLPDAMAGPTPVSALIHAATMVTAGIYMIARSHILFDLAPVVQHLIAIIGLATAVLGALVALTQTDIKKVLAYSTVSQLGYMFLGLGVGAYTGSFFHVITHAFFKALLFLCAGSVIHAMHHEQDMRHMGGLRKKLPVTFATMLIGTIAIAGLPPFSGFFSKDEILAHVYEHNQFMWGIAVFTAFLTAFYMFRMLFLTFYGTYRGTHHAEEKIHESPSSMTIPLIILAVLSAVGGIIGIPEVLGGHHWLAGWLSPVIPAHGSALSHVTEYMLMAVSVVGVIVAIAYAFVKYVKQSDLPVADQGKRSALANLSYHKFYIDEVYDLLVRRPLDALSRFFYKVVDTKIVDGIVNGLGWSTSEASKGIRLLQSGNIGFYIFMMVAGIISLLLYTYLSL